jgi:hypothetical protein
MNSVAIFSFRSAAHKLEGMGLHDATLHSVSMHWPSGEVELSIFLLGGIRVTLAFQAVTSVTLPRSQPWGPSVSINGAKTLADDLYELEMQSGDSLQFRAASWSLKIAAVPADA